MAEDKEIVQLKITMDGDNNDPYINPILLVSHTCSACDAFPFQSRELVDLDKHLEQVHGIQLKEYVETFSILTVHDILDVDIEIVFKEVEFISVLKKEDNVINAEPIINKKPFLKINGEIVKRRKIAGAESYVRQMRKKRKKKSSNEYVYIGGLKKNVFNYIPEVNETFLLTEKFHKQVATVLSSHGFKSLLLSGDTGLGKTETVEQICAHMRQPVLRQKITGNTKVKDIFQDENYDVEKKKLVKIDKRIIQAIEMGAILLVDEISACSPSVTFIFFELLEHGYVIDNDGICRDPHPMFKIVFTDNRIGNPNYFRYHGTFEQNAAFLNRLKTVIHFDNLKSSTEKRILNMKYPDCDEDFINKLIDVSKNLRSENKKGNFQEMFPIRTLESICANYEMFGNAEDAIYLGYLNSLSDETDREVVKGLCQRIFGGGMFN